MARNPLPVYSTDCAESVFTRSHTDGSVPAFGDWWDEQTDAQAAIDAVWGA